MFAGAIGGYLEQSFAPNRVPAVPQLDTLAFQRSVSGYIRSHSEEVADALESSRVQRSLLLDAQSSAVISKHFTELFSDPDSPTIGNPKGDVSIVEFFDFRCPYCKMTAGLLQNLVSKNRRVRIVLKNLPILGPDSVYAARLGLGAARVGRFPDFYRSVFLTVPSNGDRARINWAIRHIGLDPATLDPHSETSAISAAIQRDTRLANALGITGTPALLIGDNMLVGAPTKQQLETAVRTEMDHRGKSFDHLDHTGATDTLRNDLARSINHVTSP